MNILVIEDEEQLAELYEIFLLREGHEVEKKTSSLEAVELINTNHYDLIISDKRMPKVSGLDIAQMLFDKKNHTPIFLISGDELGQDIVENPNVKFFKKPFPFQELIEEINKVQSA